jgi:hypothetical protein
LEKYTLGLRDGSKVPIANDDQQLARHTGHSTVLARNVHSGNNNLDPLSECLEIQNFPEGILSGSSENCWSSVGDIFRPLKAVNHHLNLGKNVE